PPPPDAQPGAETVLSVMDAEERARIFEYVGRGDVEGAARRLHASLAGFPHVARPRMICEGSELMLAVPGIAAVLDGDLIREANVMQPTREQRVHLALNHVTESHKGSNPSEVLKGMLYLTLLREYRPPEAVAMMQQNVPEFSQNPDWERYFRAV